MKTRILCAVVCAGFVAAPTVCSGPVNFDPGGAAPDARAPLPTFARGDCGSDTLTQSTNPNVIGAATIICGDAEVSAEFSLARVFTAPYTMSVECVTFGVRLNDGPEWPVRVRVLSGPINAPYESLTLLAESVVIVPADSSFDFHTVTMPDHVIAAGSEFIVELRSDSRLPADGGDDGLLGFGCNVQGQSAPTYYRGPGCAQPDFINLADIGFGGRHLVMTLGIEAGVKSILLDGFPRSPVGGATLDEVDGAITVSGDPMAGPFGMMIEYGDTSSGVKTSTVEWDSALGNSMSFEFRAENGDVDAISLVGGADGSLALETSIQNTTDQFFDVRVYDGDDLVGVLHDQTSGSVTISTTERILWGFFGYCHNTTVTTSDSMGNTTTTTTRDYGFGANASLSIAAGGATLVGTSISIFPHEIEGINAPPPTSVAFMASGMTSFTQLSNADGATASVRFGDALTEPLTIQDGFEASVGVELSVLAGSGPIGVSGDDVDLDSVADVRLSNLGSSGNDGVQLRFGGVDSANVDMTVIKPAESGACVSLSAVQLFGGPGGTVALDPCVGCPPPFKGEWVNLVGNFAGVGSGSFTLQIVHKGSIVHQQAGMTSLVGASVGWPTKGGKLGGLTPCWRMCYPQDSLFFIAATGQQVMMDEVRLLAENAPPLEFLDLILVTAANMDELWLSNPTTVLPEIVTPCPGDTNGDNVIDFADLNTVLSSFNTATPNPSYNPGADFDNDGDVDFSDLNVLLSAFNTNC